MPKWIFGNGLALVVVFSLSGCMSVANLTGFTAPFHFEDNLTCTCDTTVYGGVKLDAKLGAAGIAFAFQEPELKPMDRMIGLAGGSYLLAVDLPVSLLVDTVTLPIAVSKQKAKKQPPSSESLNETFGAFGFVAIESKKSGVSPTDTWNFCQNYKADQYIEVAARLQAVGKEKAISLLRALAQDPDYCGKTFVLCRMLFTTKPNGDFRRPGIGCPHCYLGQPDTFFYWPLEPIALVDGVPILVVSAYALSGLPEPPEMYLDYCVKNSDWSTTRFVPKSALEKRRALEKLLDSPKLRTTISDAEKKSLLSQLE